jgi:hypothetical protein
MLIKIQDWHLQHSTVASCTAIMVNFKCWNGITCNKWLFYVDLKQHQNIIFITQDDKFPVDAYLVVYSVHEWSTYDVAIRYLEYVRNEQFSDIPIIIVANKVDLVRKRLVSNSGKHY